MEDGNQGANGAHAARGPENGEDGGAATGAPPAGAGGGGALRSSTPPKPRQADDRPQQVDVEQRRYDELGRITDLFSGARDPTSIVGGSRFGLQAIANFKALTRMVQEDEPWNEPDFEIMRAWADDLKVGGLRTRKEFAKISDNLSRRDGEDSSKLARVLGR